VSVIVHNHLALNIVSVTVCNHLSLNIVSVIAYNRMALSIVSVIVHNHNDRRGKLGYSDCNQYIQYTVAKMHRMPQIAGHFPQNSH